MVVEAVQNYVNMVNGLSKTSRERALATAKALLAQAGLEDVANDASGRVTKLAEEILLASRANRELVENLVSAEVDKAAGRWGFVRTADVDALREEIAELRLSLARATVKAADTPAKKAAKKAPARAKTAKPSVQQPPLGGATIEAVAPVSVLETEEPKPEVSPAEAAPPTPAGASNAVKAAAKKAAAKKSATRKAATGSAGSPAKKTTAKKEPTKKVAPEAAPPLVTPPELDADQ